MDCSRNHVDAEDAIPASLREGNVRESMVVSILGVQLTIGGAIVHHAYEVSGDTDQFGVPMIFLGVVLGILASVRAYRAET